MGQAGSSSRDIQYTDLSSDVKAISYKEITKATKKFNPNFVLGERTNPRIYKGWIDEQNYTATKPGFGISVAVKIMNYVDICQEHKEWIELMNYTSQLHHPNLAKLIGYSFDKNMRVVVHEFMEKGSLDRHLFMDHYPSFPWATRMKVGIVAARALAFLHGLEIPLIFGTFGSSDILLDCDFNAKLSDIGRTRRSLAFYKLSQPQVHFDVLGVCGFASPEYIQTGHSTPKSDVYSFGVVLLELMSGLRAIDNKRPPERRDLKVWAKHHLRNKRKVSEIMDSRLGGDYPHKGAHKVANIVLKCVSSDPK